MSIICLFGKFIANLTSSLGIFSHTLTLNICLQFTPIFHAVMVKDVINTCHFEI